jgi:hypothetical protein
LHRQRRRLPSRHGFVVGAARERRNRLGVNGADRVLLMRGGDIGAGCAEVGRASLPARGVIVEFGDG